MATYKKLIISSDNVSELTNDAGYLTSAPTGTALTNLRSAIFDVSGGGDSIGTTDGQNFHIKTNSTYRISITSAGVISLLGVTKVASTMQFDGNQTIETVGGSDSLYINPQANLHLGTASTDHTYIGASGRNVTINATTTAIGGTTNISGALNVSNTTAFLYVGDASSNNDGTWDTNLMMDSHHNSRLRIEQRDDNKNLELYVHAGVEPTIRATDSATTLRLGVGSNICFEMDAYSNYLRKATYVSSLRADNTDGKITIYNQGYGSKGDLFARKVDASTFHVTNTTANNTDKNGVITHSQYASDTETEGFMLMQGFSNSSTNRVDIGGGNSQHNATEEIKFHTASNSTTATGTQRMVIDATGNVGIGATSMTTGFAPNLTIEGGSPALLLRDTTSSNTATQYYTIYSANGDIKHYFDHAKSLNFATTTDNLGTGEEVKLKIDGATGNVGIGTTSPSEALHISSSEASATPVILLENTNANNLAPQLNFYNNSTSPADGDYIGQIDFEANDSAGRRTQYARIIAESTDVTNDLEDGILDLNVMYNSTLTNGLRIRGMSGGAFVGIGTSSPATKLHVKGAGEILRIENDTNADGNTYMSFHDTSAVKGYLGYTGGSSNHLNVWNVENAHVNIATNNIERITVLGGGDVGIGDTSPSYKLDVNGTGRFVGAVSFNTNVYIASGANLFLDGGSNTYIKENGADTMTFTTAGVEKVRITQGGNVGIGSGATSPSEALEINASGANLKVVSDNNVYLSLDTTQTNGDEWQIFNANSGATSTLQFKNIDQSKVVMLMDETGKVGIGTPSPSVDLHVKDASGNAQILVDSDGGSAFVDIDGHTGNDAYLRLMEANTVKWSIYNSNSTDSLLIASASDTAMTITQSGNAVFADNISNIANSSTGQYFTTKQSASGWAVTQYQSDGGTPLFNVGLESGNNFYWYSYGTTSRLMELGRTTGTLNIKGSTNALQINHPSFTSQYGFRTLQADSGNAGILTTFQSQRVSTWTSVVQIGNGSNKDNPSLRVMNGGVIFDNDVSIGTDSNDANAKFQIESSNPTTQDYIFRNTHSTAPSRIIVNSNDTGVNAQLVADKGNNFAWVGSSSGGTNRIVFPSGTNGYFEGGSFGIGITTPALSYGTGLNLSDTNTGIRLSVEGSGGWGFIEYQDEAGTIQFIQGYRDTDETYRINASNSLSNTDGIAISNSGKVGIGIVPTGTLDVNISTDARGSFTDNIGEIGSGVFALQVTNASGVALKPMGIRGEDIRLVTGSATRLKLDDNSRISLSNNDSGGTGGRDSTSGNTIFGYSAGNVNSGAVNNTFIGHASGSGSIDGGDNNTAIGAETLQGLTTASRNQAIGSYSGFSVTTGDDNVLIGNDTGFAMTGTSDTVLIGHQAGTAINNTGADGTVAVGYQSLKGLTSGAGNTAVGYTSDNYNQTGSNNTFVGYQAGLGASGNSHSSNVGIGFEAMKNIRTGSENVAIGKESMEDITSGSGNISIGTESLMNLTDGSNNIAIGKASLNASGVNPSNSVAVGTEALRYASGSNNVGVGSSAGNSITTGTTNTCIGHSSNVSAGGSTNRTALGSGVTVGGDNTVVLGNSSVTDVYASQDGGAFLHATGIKFPATQNASSSANAFDDYEEGSYTPVVSNGTTNYTASTAVGYYTKIGNQVYVQVRVVSNQAGSGGTLQVTLPFNYNGASDKYITAVPRFENIGISDRCVQLTLGNSSSGTSNMLFFGESREDNSQLNTSASNYASDSNFHFNVHYIVA